MRSLKTIQPWSQYKFKANLAELNNASILINKINKQFFPLNPFFKKIM